MENASNKRLSWIAAFTLSAFVCFAAWVISGLITQSTRDAVLTDCVLLPCSANQNIQVWSGGVIYSDGTSLHALNDAGRQKWTYPVGAGFDYTVSGSIVAAWADQTVSLLDAKGGNSLLTTSVKQNILSVAVSDSYVAALVGEEEQNASILVLDHQGKQVDAIDVAGLTILDFDFFSGGSMLWIMALNTDGSQTLSSVSTYRPGRVQSGSITDSDQLVYHVMFGSSSVKTVGTSYLKVYDYSGIEQEEQRTLLYGWTMLDCADTAEGLVILAPESEVSSEATIQDLRVISDRIDRIVRMPFPCYSVWGGSNTVYGLGEGYLMVYHLSDSRATTYTLPFEADGALSANDKNQIVLLAGNSAYLVNLPE